jgi:hypothetical protein
MNELRISEEFEQNTTRVDLIVERLGVVDALLGDGIARAMNIYNEEVAQL